MASITTLCLSSRSAMRASCRPSGATLSGANRALASKDEERRPRRRATLHALVSPYFDAEEAEPYTPRGYPEVSLTEVVAVPGADAKVASALPDIPHTSCRLGIRTRRDWRAVALRVTLMRPVHPTSRPCVGPQRGSGLDSPDGVMGATEAGAAPSRDDSGPMFHFKKAGIGAVASNLRGSTRPGEMHVVPMLVCHPFVEPTGFRE